MSLVSSNFREEEALKIILYFLIENNIPFRVLEFDFLRFISLL
jgi:hypothetical protein